MKTIIKFVYFAYHGLIPSANRVCRFTPTCSKYTIDSIGKYGVSKGFYLSLKRLLSCHPLSTRPFYDPA